jgi:hypothetical protein
MCAQPPMAVDKRKDGVRQSFERQFCTPDLLTASQGVFPRLIVLGSFPPLRTCRSLCAWAFWSEGRHFRSSTGKPPIRRKLPRDLDPARWHGQRPILGRVGRQLVRDQCNRLGRVRRQQHTRPVYSHTCRAFPEVGGKLLRNDAE